MSSTRRVTVGTASRSLSLFCFKLEDNCFKPFLVAQTVENLSAIQKTWV